jgi:hypothetical protein
MNLMVDNTPMLLLRDRATGRVRAFDRRVDDLVLKFKVNTDARRKQAVLVDQDTNSGWLTDGRPVDGPMAKANKRLQPIAVDEFVYWGVMKNWMPELRLIPGEPPAEPPQVKEPVQTKGPVQAKHRNSRGTSKTRRNR